MERVGRAVVGLCCCSIVIRPAVVIVVVVVVVVGEVLRGLRRIDVAVQVLGLRVDIVAAAVTAAERATRYLQITDAS